MANPADHQQNVENNPVGVTLILVCGLFIGIIGGFGAVVFRLMIGFFHNLLFFAEINLHYDANVHTAASIWGIGIIFIPVIGAIGVSWIIKTFAPEAKGHGVPEVIDAIYYNQGKIRPVIALFKSIASALSIGSGGSIGREGPIIQIGAAFGSTLGQLLKIPTRQCITLIAAGAGAGIAATFNAPIGGIAFAVELLLVSVNAINMAVVAIACVTATYIGRYYLGIYPAFNIPSLAIPSAHITQLTLLVPLIPFAVIMGLAATLFTKMIYWFEDMFDALPINDYLRHMLGMFLLGIIIYLLFYFTGHYYVQGVGYATIVDLLQGLLLNPAFLLLLCALKLIVTSLTLGSGGSGGIFSPSLFIGATLGIALGTITNALFPQYQIDPVVFAVCGMAAMVGAATGAVITAIVMLFEMTRDYNAILLIILTTAIAYIVRMWISKESIYTFKLARRGHNVPQGLQAATLNAQQAKHVMSRQYQLMQRSEWMKYDRGEAIPTQPLVICEQENLLGIINKSILAADKPEKNYHQCLFVPPDINLLKLLRMMQKLDYYSALVIKDANIREVEQLLGIITESEIAEYIAGIAELLSNDK